MSRRLGRPENDYALHGEGNTSARVDADTFFVKASGATLDGIDAGGFVRMRARAVLDLLGQEGLDDRGVRAGLEAARADPECELLPSVETMLHAFLLELEGVELVAHTHPTVVVGLLSSQWAAEAIAGRLFPDEIVNCGPAPCYLPYADPGVPLARAARQAVLAHMEAHGEAPKVILIGNHGLIVPGASPREVEAVTAMYVKTARVLITTYALGGPRFLTPEQVARIHTRPDEAYRRAAFRRASR